MNRALDHDRRKLVRLDDHLVLFQGVVLKMIGVRGADAEPERHSFFAVLKHKDLLRLNLGIFMLQQDGHSMTVISSVGPSANAFPSI